MHHLRSLRTKAKRKNNGWSYIKKTRALMVSFLSFPPCPMRGVRVRAARVDDRIGSVEYAVAPDVLRITDS